MPDNRSAKDVALQMYQVAKVRREQNRELYAARQYEAYVQAQRRSVDELNRNIAWRLDILTTLLARAVQVPVAPLDLTALKKAPDRHAAELGADAQPLPAPAWDDFAPNEPGGVGRMLGGQDRYVRKSADAKRAYYEAVAGHQKEEQARQARVEKAEAALRAQHDSVDKLVKGIAGRENKAVGDYFNQVIRTTPDPPGFPSSRRSQYTRESRALTLNWQLPQVDFVPDAVAYEYEEHADTIQAVEREPEEINDLYLRLAAQLALRALYVTFGADPANLLETVTFNGAVVAISPVSGLQVYPNLISIHASRRDFQRVHLGLVDPLACVRELFAAKLSPNPLGLLPVEPIGGATWMSK